MTKNTSALRAIVDLRLRNQRDRVRWNNRIEAIKRGADTEPDEGVLDILQKYHDRFLEQEKEAERDMIDLVRGVEIVERMTEIKGIGDVLAASIYSMIDITKDQYASCLWRYAGYAVAPDGKKERPVKGEKLHYNVRLKTVMYLAAVSMLRASSPYRQVYDEARDYYAANRPEWTKSHCHYAALRKMIKTFLFHLWYVWRTCEGLPTSKPYIIEKGGNHHHYLTPQAMGWSDFGEG